MQESESACIAQEEAKYEALPEAAKIDVSAGYHLLAHIIITPEALKYAPQQGARDIFLVITMPANPFLQARITSKNSNITVGLLRQHRLSSISSMFYSFEDTIVHWYRDLLLKGINFTNSTGEENHIFMAYMASPPSKTLHNPPPIYPVPPLSPASGFFFLHGFMKLENTRHKDKRKSLVSPMNPETNLTPRCLNL